MSAMRRWLLGAVAGMALTQGLPLQAEETTAPTGAEQAPVASVADTTPVTPAVETAPAATAVTAPAAAAAETAPAPAVSPIQQLVLQDLANSGRKSVEAADRSTLTAFYGTPGRELLWVTSSGLTPRATAVISEIRKAADWGLSPASFDTPDPQASLSTPEAVAAAEVRIALAVLKYARHARGGRIDVSQLGRNVDQKPPLLEPGAVLGGIAAAPQPDKYLTGLHPKHPQFAKLRQALLASRKPAAAEPPKAAGADIKLPSGPRIKPGQSHPQVALLRQRLGVANDGASAQSLDQSLAAALREFQESKGIEPDGVLNNVTRTALNGVARPAATAGESTQRILVNMERWRWLPEDLGQIYVWDNIPEYRMRVMKADKAIHSETIIVGKPSTPTPMFSADMKYVIFHPTWGVPDGIKMNELAPSLRNSSSFWGGSDPAVLRRHNLRVSYNGRPVDPSSVDWGSVDIRNFQFTQPPSASNVLGVVKFRFPNKHDVYMHDTPERELFSRADKAFSHGCMRVQNPRRLAEVLLAEDKGWSSAQVGNAIAAGATQEVTLTKQIPVHVTYFTAVVDEQGHLKTFGDIYGHDSRIASALEGKPIKLIAQSDPGVAAEREVRRKTARAKSGSGGGSLFDIFSGLAGN